MKKKFTIQYRCNGMWVNGNTFESRQQAEKYATQTGRDYQIIPAKR